MTIIDQCANDLSVWLDLNQPFLGYRYDIAAAIGYPTIYVDFALAQIRDPATVAVTGWTIPMQSRGSGPKDWRKIDIATGLMTTDEVRSGHDALERRNQENIRRILRDLALLDTIYAKTDHRSAYGRAVNVLRSAFNLAQATLDATPVP